MDGSKKKIDSEEISENEITLNPLRLIRNSISLIGANRIKITCLDILNNEEFLVCGTSTGSVYVFENKKNQNNIDIIGDIDIQDIRISPIYSDEWSVSRILSHAPVNSKPSPITKLKLSGNGEYLSLVTNENDKEIMVFMKPFLYDVRIPEKVVYRIDSFSPITFLSWSDDDFNTPLSIYSTGGKLNSIDYSEYLKSSKISNLVAFTGHEDGSIFIHRLSLTKSGAVLSSAWNVTQKISISNASDIGSVFASARNVLKPTQALKPSDSQIIQMDVDSKRGLLLVSTLTRTLLYDIRDQIYSEYEVLEGLNSNTEEETLLEIQEREPSQIGSKLRNGIYGSCFVRGDNEHPISSSSSFSGLICMARPKHKFWIGDPSTFSVLSTLDFRPSIKDLQVTKLLDSNSKLVDKELEYSISEISKYPQFGMVIHLGNAFFSLQIDDSNQDSDNSNNIESSSLFLTIRENSISLVNLDMVCVQEWHIQDEIKSIQDVKVTKNGTIFILHKNEKNKSTLSRLKLITEIDMIERLAEFKLWLPCGKEIIHNNFFDFDRYDHFWVSLRSEIKHKDAKILLDLDSIRKKSKLYIEKVENFNKKIKLKRESFLREKKKENSVIPSRPITPSSNKSDSPIISSESTFNFDKIEKIPTNTEHQINVDKIPAVSDYTPEPASVATAKVIQKSKKKKKDSKKSRKANIQAPNKSKGKKVLTPLTNRVPVPSVSGDDLIKAVADATTSGRIKVSEDNDIIENKEKVDNLIDEKGAKDIEIEIENNNKEDKNEKEIVMDQNENEDKREDDDESTPNKDTKFSKGKSEITNIEKDILIESLKLDTNLDCQKELNIIVDINAQDKQSIDMYKNEIAQELPLSFIEYSQEVYFELSKFKFGEYLPFDTKLMLTEWEEEYQELKKIGSEEINNLNWIIKTELLSLWVESGIVSGGKLIKFVENEYNDLILDRIYYYMIIQGLFNDLKKVLIIEEKFSNSNSNIDLLRKEMDNLIEKEEFDQVLSIVSDIVSKISISSTLSTSRPNFSVIPTFLNSLDKLLSYEKFNDKLISFFVKYFHIFNFVKIANSDLVSDLVSNDIISKFLNQLFESHGNNLCFQYPELLFRKLELNIYQGLEFYESNKKFDVNLTNTLDMIKKFDIHKSLSFLENLENLEAKSNIIKEMISSIIIDFSIYKNSISDELFSKVLNRIFELDNKDLFEKFVTKHSFNKRWEIIISTFIERIMNEKSKKMIPKKTKKSKKKKNMIEPTTNIDHGKNSENRIINPVLLFKIMIGNLNSFQILQLLKNHDFIEFLPFSSYDQLFSVSETEFQLNSSIQEVLEVVDGHLWSQNSNLVSPQVEILIESENSGRHLKVDYPEIKTFSHSLKRNFEIKNHWGVRVSMENQQCQICTLPVLEKIDSSEIIVFSCGHAFHHSCIPLEVCIKCNPVKKNSITFENK